MGCVSSKTDESTPPPNANAAVKDDAPKKLDPLLPFASYREFYTLKNYWKAVGRKEKESAKGLLIKLFTDNPTYKERYTKLANLDMNDMEKVMASTVFEKIALEYLQVFDDVISQVEAMPEDATQACNTLRDTGKAHKSRCTGLDSGVFQSMEEPFLKMVSNVLDDRYNEKSETLFRKFFQFCLKYLVEGFNS